MSDDFPADRRFKHVTSDPRFRSLPRRDRKVRIDERFQGMFTDEKFKSDYSVDLRGRPVKKSSTDDLKKYYDLSESSQESSGDEADKSDSDDEPTEEAVTGDKADKSDSDEPSDDHVGDKPEAESEAGDEPQSKTEDDHVESEAGDQPGEVSARELKREKIRDERRRMDIYHKYRNSEAMEKLKDVTVDYARGMGILDSAEESSSDETTSDESEIELVHPWGELDKDAEETDQITKRLAVCNLDWDRIEAKDLMVLFNSFLPVDGVIESITIYPSEFGLERMKEEETKGPLELAEDEKLKKFKDKDFEDKHAAGSKYAMEKLREYQLKRLRYYYGVIVFNTPETANVIFSECDGMEYESSATKIDLRFIPDDMVFDQKPREVCTALPDLTSYKPRLFANTALQQGKVSSTWDETNPERVEFTRKIMTGGQIDGFDAKAYIASSSESDNDEGGELKVEMPPPPENATPMEKYKALLAEVQKEEEKKASKKGDFMEITWGVGLGDGSDSGEEIGPKTNKKDKDALKKKKKVDDDDDEEITEEEKAHRANLELLLADDDPEEDTKKHFNLKDIIKQEKSSTKKSWKRRIKEKIQAKSAMKEEDDFKVDVADERFSALYTSHLYNIDPSDPHFVKTKAVDEIINEKQRRRKKPVLDSEGTENKRIKTNSELGDLIKSVKSKSKRRF